MSHTINADIDVDVPVGVAFDRWSRFEDLPAFMGGVESVTRTSETSLHWKLSVGGVHREFDADITEMVPNTAIAWRSTQGELHAGRVSFEPVDADSTHVDLVIEWEPQDTVEKVGAALQIDDMQAANDLRRFKEAVENSGV
jgi:uncharacterized membrane protein